MLPLFEPVFLMFAPVTAALVVLAVVGMAGMLAVVGLVARSARPRATQSPVRPRLKAAA